MARLPLVRLLSLALRQLLRDARAGELRVLFFAVLVAVAASTAIGYFGARLNGAMVLRATEFLGADLVLEGSSPAREEQIRVGNELGLKHAQIVEFSSVIATDNGIQLSSIKAADDAYPLRGQLKSAAQPYGEEQPGGGPKSGQAWVEPRLLTALDLKVGDDIDVGSKTVKITRVLTYEPDRAGNFYSLTPRVLINLDDLQATGIVQPGSRVSFRELWRGEAPALQSYRDVIQPGLEANQRLLDGRDGNQQIGGALGKAERYLNMASLVAVLLAGVAVALSATRFANRRFDASALLRCLGLSRRETLWLFSLQLAMLGLLASVTGALLGGGVIAALILGGLLLLGLKGLRRGLARASLPWRLGLGQLLRQPLAAAGQALAFGLILLSMALIALLRGELLDTWQNQLPKDAPNYFALNILPTDKDAFGARLHELQAQAAPIYPVVPGRLISINGEPVQEIVTKDSSGDKAVQRDLSLTWAADLPEGNELTAGQWWSAQPPQGVPGVSVEAKVAESLKLKLGDHLVFTVAGVNREAQVTSLRSINWDNFQPNFFMIFQPGTLQDLPTTYLTSFYLAPGHDTQIIELSRSFPAVTILPIDALLEQLRSILAQVTIAIEYVLLFVLAAGMTVLFSGLQSTLDERIRQGALLRALGAERQLLIKARRIEFGLLGATSGLLAAVGAELVSLVLYRYAFDLPWHPHPWLLLLPVLGAVMVGGAGVFGTRRALNASPLTVLREG
ncbi:ABC transporter permease [Pseudomonas helleri]|uniref:FtsX-like permease family protein n=1 Tax=Pseudomonas helleri TaxID=1608996 RepID=A0A6L5HTL7_9PSED|nr:FtsX-like permease family protein [Pseudomonas helleri]MQU06724.1 FtsX-like permease family protein [Pseudomonas helleri]